MAPVARGSARARRALATRPLAKESSINLGTTNGKRLSRFPPPHRDARSRISASSLAACRVFSCRRGRRRRRRSCSAARGRRGRRGRGRRGFRLGFAFGRRRVVAGGRLLGFLELRDQAVGVVGQQREQLVAGRLQQRQAARIGQPLLAQGRGRNWRAGLAASGASQLKKMKAMAQSSRPRTAPNRKPSDRSSAPILRIENGVGNPDRDEARRRSARRRRSRRRRHRGAAPPC